MPVSGELGKVEKMVRTAVAAGGTSYNERRV